MSMMRKEDHLKKWKALKNRVEDEILRAPYLKYTIENYLYILYM